MAKKERELGPFDWQSLPGGPVIGVDEVGRGCLAGSVFAAAVVLDSLDRVDELTDSKLLSEKRREDLCEWIKSSCRYGIGFATVDEIFEINILQASLLAMKRAVQKLGVVGHVLIDGNIKIPGVQMLQTTLVKGDLRAAPVGAASILAKVTRDHEMQDLEKIYPGYALSQNKGYGSAAHLEAIQRLGPTPIHRKGFRGVREYCETGIVERNASL